MKKGRWRPINRILFFIGWILSPFTFWNDAFINIPIAYFLANLVVRFFGDLNFFFLVLVFYWLSNILGVFIMYSSGKALAKAGGLIREIAVFFITVILYSAILMLLNGMGVLRPIQFFR